MHERSNKRIEVAVENGLALALLENMSAGLIAMVGEGVPLEVATRVLLYPQLRRVTDWKH